MPSQSSSLMVLCNVHVLERNPNRGSRWPFISYPAVTVLFVPFAGSRVEVSPSRVSDCRQVDREELARSLRQELSKFGRYSVAELSNELWER